MTHAGAKTAVLYDGHCRFCTASASAVARLFGTERVVLEDFQAPGVLGHYQGISYDACMKEMHVVTPDGRVFAGAEAFARLLMQVRGIGVLGRVYYVPGLRQLADGVYALIAKYRYRVLGRTADCDSGTCHLHR
jgi:predicted DCC family thiol-disulfide oxidoreductase YuxK